MLIRYVNMAFFLGVIIYTQLSRKFKKEAASVIGSIREAEQET